MLLGAKATFRVAEETNQGEKPMSGYLGSPPMPRPQPRGTQEGAKTPSPTLAGERTQKHIHTSCAAPAVSRSPLSTSVSPPCRAAVKIQQVHTDEALRTGPGTHSCLLNVNPLPVLRPQPPLQLERSFPSNPLAVPVNPPCLRRKCYIVTKPEKQKALAQTSV